MTDLHEILKILGDEQRLHIVRYLWKNEASVGEVSDAVGGSMTGVSQHLRILRHSGLVKVRREGRYRLYRADHSQFGWLAISLERYWTGRLEHLRVTAERKETRLAERKRKH